MATTIRRGDIWQISFDPTIGSEIKKTRPAVVLSSDDLGLLPVKIVVPITEYKDYYREFPWHVKLEASKTSGLKKPSSADCLQCKSLSTERFLKRMGTLTSVELDEILNAIALCLEM